MTSGWVLVAQVRSSWADLGLVWVCLKVTRLKSCEHEACEAMCIPLSSSLFTSSSLSTPSFSSLTAKEPQDQTSDRSLEKQPMNCISKQLQGQQQQAPQAIEVDNNSIDNPPQPPMSFCDILHSRTAELLSQCVFSAIVFPPFGGYLMVVLRFRAGEIFFFRLQGG